MAIVKTIKTEKDFWAKLQYAVELMDRLNRGAFKSEIRVYGAKIRIQVRCAENFTDKDRSKILKIHEILGCPFVKSYTHTNRVKYSGNLGGISVTMNTNIPAFPSCELVSKTKTLKTSFYNCKTGAGK